MNEPPDRLGAVKPAGELKDENPSIMVMEEEEHETDEVCPPQSRSEDDPALDQVEQHNAVSNVQPDGRTDHAGRGPSTTRGADMYIRERRMIPSPKREGCGASEDATTGQMSPTTGVGPSTSRGEGGGASAWAFTAVHRSLPLASAMSRGGGRGSATTSPAVVAENPRSYVFPRLKPKTSAPPSTPVPGRASTPPTGAPVDGASAWDRRGSTGGRPGSLLPRSLPTSQAQGSQPHQPSTPPLPRPLPPPPLTPQLALGGSVPQKESEGSGAFWHTDDSAAEADIESMASVASVDSREDDLEVGASTDSEVASTASSTGGCSSVCSDSSRSRVGDRDSRWSEEGEEDVLLGLSLARARETAGRAACSCRQPACFCRFKSSVSSRVPMRPTPLPPPLGRSQLDPRDLALVADMSRMTRSNEGMGAGDRLGSSRGARGTAVAAGRGAGTGGAGGATEGGAQRTRGAGNGAAADGGGEAAGVASGGAVGGAGSGASSGACVSVVGAGGGAGGGAVGVHPDRALEFAEKFVRRDISLAGRAHAVRLLKMSTSSIYRVVVRRGGFRALYGWLGDVWERVRAHKLPRAGSPDWRGVGGRLYVEDLLGVLARVPISVDMLRETEIARVAKKFRRLAERHGIDSMIAASNRLRAHLHAVVSRGVQEGLFFRNRGMERYARSAYATSGAGAAGGSRVDRHSIPFYALAGRQCPESWPSRASWRPGPPRLGQSGTAGGRGEVPAFVSTKLGGPGEARTWKVGERAGRGSAGSSGQGQGRGALRIRALQGEGRGEEEVGVRGGKAADAIPSEGQEPRSPVIGEDALGVAYQSADVERDRQGWRRPRAGGVRFEGAGGAIEEEEDDEERVGSRLDVLTGRVVSPSGSSRDAHVHGVETSASMEVRRSAGGSGRSGEGDADPGAGEDGGGGAAEEIGQQELEQMGIVTGREDFLVLKSRLNRGQKHVKHGGRDSLRLGRIGGDEESEGAGVASTRRGSRRRGVAKTEPFLLDLSKSGREADRRGRGSVRLSLSTSPGAAGGGGLRYRGGDGSTRKSSRDDPGDFDVAGGGVTGDGDAGGAARSPGMHGELSGSAGRRNTLAYWSSPRGSRSDRQENASEDGSWEESGDWWPRPRSPIPENMYDAYSFEHHYLGAGAVTNYPLPHYPYWKPWDFHLQASPYSLPTVPTFEESGRKVSWADYRGHRLAEVHEIEPGYSREDFALPGRVGFTTERRDMSKKEEQLLSQEDHDRLAAAALDSALRERGYGGAGSGGGDSEGTISDSENSTTGEPDIDNLSSVEDETPAGAASPAGIVAGSEPGADTVGDGGDSRADEKSGDSAKGETERGEGEGEGGRASLGADAGPAGATGSGGAGARDDGEDSASGLREQSAARTEGGDSPSRSSKRDIGSDEGSESCSSQTSTRRFFSSMEGDTPPGSPAVSSPARRSPSPLERRSSPGSPEVSSPGSSRSGSLLSEHLVRVPTVPPPLRGAVRFLSVGPISWSRRSPPSRTYRSWETCGNDVRSVHRRPSLAALNRGNRASSNATPSADPSAESSRDAVAGGRLGNRGRDRSMDRGDDSGDASDLSGGGGSGTVGSGEEPRSSPSWSESTPATSSRESRRWTASSSAGTGLRGGLGRGLSGRGGNVRREDIGRQRAFGAASERGREADVESADERRGSSASRSEEQRRLGGGGGKRDMIGAGEEQVHGIGGTGGNAQLLALREDAEGIGEQDETGRPDQDEDDDRDEAQAVMRAGSPTAVARTPTPLALSSPLCVTSGTRTTILGVGVGNRFSDSRLSQLGRDVPLLSRRRREGDDVPVEHGEGPREESRGRGHEHVRSVGEPSCPGTSTSPAGSQRRSDARGARTRSPSDSGTQKPSLRNGDAGIAPDSSTTAPLPGAGESLGDGAVVVTAPERMTRESRRNKRSMIGVDSSYPSSETAVVTVTTGEHVTGGRPHLRRRITLADHDAVLEPGYGAFEAPHSRENGDSSLE